MTSFIQDQGRALLAGGYLVVPIIPGEKRPALPGWQNARLTAADLGRYPGHGVGVLCGVGEHPLVGVDIDISHQRVGPAVQDWCRENLGMACERVGDAPRVLFAYRADTGAWAKGYSVAFFDPSDPVKTSGKRNEQRVEILCAGQQFVAYHVHPDTGRPYEWVDVFGGLEHMPAADLTVITEQQVNALLAFVADTVRTTPGIEVLGGQDALVSSAGGSADLLMGIEPVCGLTLSQAQSYLALHASDEHDHWVRVGMALHHEFSGAPEALALWDDWSSKAPNWKAGECATRWASFGRRTGSAPTTMRWVIKLANQARADQQQDTLREQLQQIKAVLAQAQDTVDLTGPVARRVKELMPDNKALQAQVMADLQKRFNELSGGTKLPVADVKRLVLPVAEAKALPPGIRALNEFGNAERLLDKFGQGLRFVPEVKQWYAWSGVYWRPVTETAIEQLAQTTIRAMHEEVDKHADGAAFYAWCAQSQHAYMVANMVRLACADPRVFTPIAELDKELRYLCATNGIVDLWTGELLPPDPSRLITQCAGTLYNPAATCPTFERTVLEAFCGDRALADFWLTLVAYAMGGEPVLNLLVIMFGYGANGKSTLLNAVRLALGTYAKAADAATFVTDGKSGGNAGGPREDLVRLRGARLVYVNEPDEGGELREGAVKAMTGGDAVVARGINAKSSVEFVPTWTPFMPTNHQPIIKGSDHGIWRRIVNVPFTRNFEAEGLVDRNLGAKIKAELPGILALLVRYHVQYRKEGLVTPDSVVQAKVDYRERMDLLSSWLDECCEIDPGYECAASDLWASWQNFAGRNGVLNYVRSSIALGRRLDSRFRTSKGTGGVRIRIGLRLRDPFSV